MDVFAPEIMQHIKQMHPLNCKDNQPDLIYTENGYAKLKPQILEQYQDAHCLIVYVLRVNDYVTKLTSDPVNLSVIKPYAKLEHDYFEANCRIPSKSVSFTRIYASVSRDDKLVDKLKQKTNKNEMNLNVLFYGMIFYF